MDQRRIGYIRISDKTQNEDRQLDEMKAQGIADRDLYIDKVSGKDFQRHEYENMKRAIRKGDILFIKSIDRLGRNSKEIKREWEAITQDIAADMVVIDMPLLDTRQYRDTLGTFVSDLVLQVLAFVAQKEREDIRQRQAEGIASAKRRGKHLGRPQIKYDTLTETQRTILREKYPLWCNKEIKAVEFMQLLGLRKTSFYKVVKEYNQRIH